MNDFPGKMSKGWTSSPIVDFLGICVVFSARHVRGLEEEAMYDTNLRSLAQCQNPSPVRSDMSWENPQVLYDEERAVTRVLMMLNVWRSSWGVVPALQYIYI